MSVSVSPHPVVYANRREANPAVRHLGGSLVYPDRWWQCSAAATWILRRYSLGSRSVFLQYVRGVQELRGTSR